MRLVEPLVTLVLVLGLGVILLRRYLKGGRGRR